MPERVLLQLDPQGSPEWLDLARSGDRPRAGWPPAGAQVVLLLPAETVLLTRAPRVAKSEALLRQALPYAVEDRLAGPVEHLHFAFSGSADPLALAVVDRDLLRARLDAVEAQGLTVVAAYSEASLLPLPADGAGLIVLDPQRVLIRSPRGETLTESRAALAELIALVEAASPGAHWRLIRCGQAPIEGLPATWMRDPQPAASLLQLAAAHWPPKDAPNLLQGAFAVRLRGDALPWLKRAAAIAAAAGVLAFAQAIVERHQLQARIDSQRLEMAALLQQALPEVRNVVDPRAQLEIEYRRLAQGAAGDDALALLARIAPSLSGSSRYTLESIDYRGGGLDITLRAPDVATLDGLREALAGLGLSAELTSATPGQGGVEGRISLRGGRA